jgi:predicted ABC-type ATPase
VNADYIARGLSGPRAATVAIEAGRIMLKRLRQLASSDEEFAFESTLSSRSFALFLRGLKRQGYRRVIFSTSACRRPRSQCEECDCA